MGGAPIGAPPIRGGPPFIAGKPPEPIGGAPIGGAPIGAPARGGPLGVGICIGGPPPPVIGGARAIVWGGPPPGGPINGGPPVGGLEGPPIALPIGGAAAPTPMRAICAVGGANPFGADPAG